MESKPTVSKKALAILGFMLVGSMANKVDIVCDYKEVNCNVYDHSNGVCMKCSHRYWMTERHTCVQVDSQCKDWCPDNGDCTDCYQGWVLSKGKCVLPTQGSGNGVVSHPPVVNNYQPPVVDTTYKPPVINIYQPPVQINV